MYSNDSPAGSQRALFASVLFLFYISGFSALLYQVVWQRLLATVTGIDNYSVTIIVSTFMGGLGFGSIVGGYVADRLTDRGRLLLFAAAELMIGLFALSSKWFYYDVLYMKFSFLTTSLSLKLIIIFLSLLIPTFLMGVTLPLLSKTFSHTVKKAAATIATLYGINTLGAATGALVTGWVIVRSFGYVTTIHIGAALSFICAGGALAAMLLLHKPVERGEALSATANEGSGVKKHIHLFGLPTWMSIYALSGFIALSLEILWFRILTIISLSTPFVFANLLTIFLAGLGAGTLVGIIWARGSERPARTFFALQAAITLYSGITLAIFIALLGSPGLLENIIGAGETDLLFPALSKLFSDPGALTYAERSDVFQFALSSVFVPFVLIAPPTFLMGLSFPFLQKTVQTEEAYIGRRVGLLQTANILGSMCGALLVGLASFKYLGSSWTLKAIILINGLYLFLWARVRFAEQTSLRNAAYALSACLVIIVAALSPSSHKLWSKIHDTEPELITFVEDGSGLNLIKTDPTDRRRAIVYANGVSVSSFPYGSSHTFLGFVPAMLHPAPKDVIIIGLGSAETLFGLVGRRDIERIISIEIMPRQINLLKRFNRDYYHSEALTHTLNDKRVTHVFEDGRAYIQHRKKKYDIIESDARSPYQSFSGNLFSKEHFEMVREHLNPGGLAITWHPTLRILKTFVKTFPYVMQFGELFSVGSNEPIIFDAKVLSERIDRFGMEEHFLRAGVTLEGLKSGWFSTRRTEFGPEFDRTKIIDFNSDMLPKDEYLLPVRRLY